MCSYAPSHLIIYPNKTTEVGGAVLNKNTQDVSCNYIFSHYLKWTCSGEPESEGSLCGESKH